MKFRKLITNTVGSVYLFNMPARYGESLDVFFKMLEAANIQQIICLTSNDEISIKSPEYYEAIKNDPEKSSTMLPVTADGKTQVKRVSFPVPDYGVPENVDEFYKLALDTSELVKKGGNILVHCAGGIGRTGMFAGCLLQALGESLDALDQSGSGPEDHAQSMVIQNFHSKTNNEQ